MMELQNPHMLILVGGSLLRKNMLTLLQSIFPQSVVSWWT